MNPARFQIQITNLDTGEKVTATMVGYVGLKGRSILASYGDDFGMVRSAPVGMELEISGEGRLLEELTVTP